MEVSNYKCPVAQQPRYDNKTAKWRHKGSPLICYGVALLTVVFALFLTLQIDLIATRTPFALFYAAVGITAWFSGRWPGLAAIALSALATNYFVLHPLYTFAPTRASLAQEATFVGVALLIVWLTSAHRHSEESLHKSRERHRVIADTAYDAIITIDEASDILFVNPAATRVFGYSREEMLGQNLTMLMPEALRSGHLTGIHRYLESSRRHLNWNAIELPGLHKDGQEIPLELSFGEVIEDGRHIFTGVIRDISERKRGEEKIVNLAGIVESSDDAIFSKTLEGVITSWNSGAERIYGYKAAEVVGQSVRVLVSRERYEELAEILARVSRGERLNHFETMRLTKNGRSIHVSLTISPIKNSSGEIIGASTIARDVTNRKLAEEEVYRLNATLEQRVAEQTAELRAANKELEAFSYSVSHDLRAPLRHINGFSQALLDDYGPRLDDEGKYFLRELRNASEEMAELIDDMLQLARVTRSEMRRELVDLSELAQQILNELQSREPSRQVTAVVQPELSAHGDRRLLRVMLTNLLGNAWKFTSRKGDAQISFGRIQSDQQDCYFVRDNGAGFDMAYIGKLFGAFQRLHTPREFEGTGIGLATVQRIVSRHGGRVWAEGAVDSGATFYFSLPTSHESEDLDDKVIEPQTAIKVS